MKMSKLHKTLCMFIAASAVAIGAARSALADKVHLKDGRVIEGTVVLDTDSFVRIKIKIGGIESIQTFDKLEVVKVEKDVADAPKTDAPVASSKSDKEKTEEEKKAERDRILNSNATRVAILNFGAPSEWGSEVNDMVGREITSQDWIRAIPLLEKDHVQVVVVRINSGGGALSEMQPFQEMYQYQYKPRFRTVAWVESAISCAAMSPYPIEEFYFMPNGSLGACTGWSGNLVAMKGAGLEQVIALMETASKWGKRAPEIMKSMQVLVPLSCTIDPTTGEVHWFQDTTGEHVLNDGSTIVTLTAQDAVKYKFAKGIARNKEELAKVMGLNEVVWAGEEATRYIDDQLKASDRAHRRWQLVAEQYGIEVEYASQAADQRARGAFVGKARGYLNELRSMYRVNRNFGQFTGIDDEWFEDQEDLLRRLMR